MKRFGTHTSSPVTRDEACHPCVTPMVTCVCFEIEILGVTYARPRGPACSGRPGRIGGVRGSHSPAPPTVCTAETQRRPRWMATRWVGAAGVAGGVRKGTDAEALVPDLPFSLHPAARVVLQKSVALLPGDRWDFSLPVAWGRDSATAHAQTLRGGL